MFLEESGLGVPESGGGRRDSGEVRRFWIPNNKSAEVIFLTDLEKVRSFSEHVPKIDGSFRNYFSCLKDLGEDCPMCEYADKHRKFWARKCNVLTVQNVGTWTNKEGKEVKNNSKELLVLRKKGVEVLKVHVDMLVKKGKPLRGAKFIVSRSGDEFSPGTGDVWVYDEHVDLKEMEDSSELDYKSILAHDRNAMMKALAKLEGHEKAKVEAENYEVEEPEYVVDDEVPF